MYVCICMYVYMYVLYVCMFFFLNHYLLTSPYTCKTPSIPHLGCPVYLCLKKVSSFLAPLATCLDIETDNWGVAFVLSVLLLLILPSLQTTEELISILCGNQMQTATERTGLKTANGAVMGRSCDLILS